jgi:hypothetical protein
MSMLDVININRVTEHSEKFTSAFGGHIIAMNNSCTRVCMICCIRIALAHYPFSKPSTSCCRSAKDLATSAARI